MGPMWATVFASFVIVVFSAALNGFYLIANVLMLKAVTFYGELYARR